MFIHTISRSTYQNTIHIRERGSRYLSVLVNQGANFTQLAPTHHILREGRPKD